MLLFGLRPGFIQPLPGRVRWPSLSGLRLNGPQARATGVRGFVAARLLLGCCPYLSGLIVSWHFNATNLVLIPLLALPLGSIVGFSTAAHYSRFRHDPPINSGHS